MRSGLLLSALGTLLLTAACAGGGGGAAASFRADMGRLLPEPLATTRAKIWAQHQVPLYRETQDANRIVYESEWIPREPTPEERVNGVTAARNQVIIQGRRTEEGMDMSGGSAVYRVYFEVKNEVLVEGSQDWVTGAIPRPVVDRYREVLSDMELELRTGVRR